jgi:hypothetical protein
MRENAGALFLKSDDGTVNFEGKESSRSERIEWSSCEKSADGRSKCAGDNERSSVKWT